MVETVSLQDKNMSENSTEMKTYIGVKMIEAKPMTLHEWFSYRTALDLETPAVNEEDDEPGYFVQYRDGYESWSPSSAFEAAYLQLSDPTRITPEVVEGIISNTDVSRVKSTTVVMLETKIGFDSMAYSACVDPNNYDEAKGTELASKKAADKLWMGLGFVLAWAKNGLKKIS